jgi:uncharacterized protein YjiK
MKTLALFFALALAAQAALINVNVGTTQGDGTGDGLRTSFIKINTNAVALSEKLDGHFWASGGTNFGTNIQWRMVKHITLTNVVDVSACAWNANERRFYTIHNNASGRITRWTLDGVCDQIITGPGAGASDCEEITWLGGNRYAVSEEDNNRIFILSITNGTTAWATNNTTIIQLPASIGTDPGSGSGVEGLAYDHDRAGWWVAREKSPAQLMFVDSATLSTNNFFSDAQMQQFTNANHTDFSSLHLDRFTQTLWVGQDEGGAGGFDRVIGISLLTSNLIATIDCTNMTQLEGVSVLNDGKILVAGEANQFAIYEPYIGGRNTGFDWERSTTITLPDIPSFPFGAVSRGSNSVRATAITVSTSPQHVTNLFGVNIFASLSGGAVQGVALNGFAWSRAFTNASLLVPLQPGEWLSVTQTTAPYLVWKPF